MLNQLTLNEKEWLLGETVLATARKMPEGKPCMMPGCGNMATGRMPFFAVKTRFSSELLLCNRCGEMIIEAQIARVN